MAHGDDGSPVGLDGTLQGRGAVHSLHRAPAGSATVAIVPYGVAFGSCASHPGGPAENRGDPPTSEVNGSALRAPTGARSRDGMVASSLWVRRRRYDGCRTRGSSTLT